MNRKFPAPSPQHTCPLHRKTVDGTCFVNAPWCFKTHGIYIYINLFFYLFIHLFIYLSIYWYNVYRNLHKKNTWKKTYIIPGQWPRKAWPFNFDEQVKTYYNLTGTYLHLNLLVFNQFRSLFLAGSRQDLAGSGLHHKVKSNMMYHVHSTIYDSITCGQMSE